MQIAAYLLGTQPKTGALLQTIYLNFNSQNAPLFHLKRVQHVMVLQALCLLDNKDISDIQHISKSYRLMNTTKNLTKTVFQYLVLVVGIVLVGQHADAETISLKSGESRKITEHVSCGIRFFGLNYLSFENPSEKNGNNIEGWSKVSLWDKGKLVTLSVSEEDWQETRVRTTQGCIAGRRLSSAKFSYDIRSQAKAPPASKAIENTDVQLVNVTYYPERQAK